MKFLDQAKIYIRSGDGGNGCVGFRRERNIEFGGPDGGDGGRGGDVIAICVPDLNTLIDFRYIQHFKAERGGGGSGQQRAGASGKSATLRLPLGTQILADDEAQTLVADLTVAGQKVVLARGGDGGRGNIHFKTSTNRAPRRAENGFPCEERWLWLRLKLIADIGIVGLPNAGKSTFLSAVSRATPKIADYPFTTLHPALGVARVGEREMVIADIPGLIEGAHDGKGLGDRFLGHVERCVALLHLIDGTLPIEEAVAAYRTVQGELSAYGADLAEKRQIVAINKIDAIPAAEAAALRDALAHEIGVDRQNPLLMISGVAGKGVSELLYALSGIVEETARAQLAPTETDPGPPPHLDAVAVRQDQEPSSQ